jgi:replication fork clamp-binding protein CrfC
LKNENSQANMFLKNFKLNSKNGHRLIFNKQKVQFILLMQFLSKIKKKKINSTQGIEGDFEIVYVDFKSLDKLLGIYSKREGFFFFFFFPNKFLIIIINVFKVVVLLEHS